DNSLRTICQKVKELNPKKIHLFKKILEKKLATKQTGNIIGDRDNFCSVTGRGIFQALLKCDLYIIEINVET
ncbi:MAG: hypothetical protein PF503_09510, partial [Desulfobacula sp.]|nr:hypothetical protein [Desulfobacula sp.]